MEKTPVAPGHSPAEIDPSVQPEEPRTFEDRLSDFEDLLRHDSSSPVGATQETSEATESQPSPYADTEGSEAAKEPGRTRKAGGTVARIAAKKWREHQQKSVDDLHAKNEARKQNATLRQGQRRRATERGARASQLRMAAEDGDRAAQRTIKHKLGHNSRMGAGLERKEKGEDVIARLRNDKIEGKVKEYGLKDPRPPRTPEAEPQPHYSAENAASTFRNIDARLFGKNTLGVEIEWEGGKLYKTDPNTKRTTLGDRSEKTDQEFSEQFDIARSIGLNVTPGVVEKRDGGLYSYSSDVSLPTEDMLLPRPTLDKNRGVYTDYRGRDITPREAYRQLSARYLAENQDVFSQPGAFSEAAKSVLEQAVHDGALRVSSEEKDKEGRAAFISQIANALGFMVADPEVRPDGTVEIPLKRDGSRDYREQTMIRELERPVVPAGNSGELEARTEQVAVTPLAVLQLKQAVMNELNSLTVEALDEADRKGEQLDRGEFRKRQEQKIVNENIANMLGIPLEEIGTGITDPAKERQYRYFKNLYDMDSEALEQLATEQLGQIPRRRR